MDNRYFFELAEKHAKGECTEQEINLLITYYDVLSAQHKAQLGDHQIEEIEQLIWSRIAKRMGNDVGRRETRKRTRRLLWYSFAATIALAITVGSLFFFRDDTHQHIAHTPNKIMPPGSNKATLITANGQVIALDGEKGGIADGGERIQYEDGTAVAVLPDTRRTDGVSRTIRTPPGGQYAVVLPDGSKVWLNAHSSLTYPSRFDEDKREVFLAGEAYFDVTQRQNTAGVGLPFKVVTEKQTIEVLGTEFNVAAYPEEDSEKTTLVSGAVKVSIRQNGETVADILKPGEQGVVNGSGMAVQQADVYSATAWKSGRFSFDDKPFQEIMAELGRWYNFEVAYDGPIPTPQFMGGAFRTDSISSVLYFLESANLAYKIEPDSDGTYQLTIKTRKGK